MHANLKDQEITFVIEVRIDELEVAQLNRELKSKAFPEMSEVLVRTILASAIPME